MRDIRNMKFRPSRTIISDCWMMLHVISIMRKKFIASDLERGQLSKRYSQILAMLDEMKVYVSSQLTPEQSYLLLNFGLSISSLTSLCDTYQKILMALGSNDQQLLDS